MFLRPRLPTKVLDEQHIYVLFDVELEIKEVTEKYKRQKRDTLL